MWLDGDRVRRWITGGAAMVLCLATGCSFSPDTAGSLIDCTGGKPCPEGWYCPATGGKVCVRGVEDGGGAEDVVGQADSGGTDGGGGVTDAGPLDAGTGDGGACASVCPSTGASGCANPAQYHLCGDQNSDGCLEWGAPQDCPGGVCENDQCTGCAIACSGKECGDDGCSGSCGACDKPPQASCQSSRSLRTFDPAGACGATGECSYTSADQECYYGCANGKCIDCTPDCAGKLCGDNGCGEPCGVCDKAPADSCLNASTMRDYDLQGICTAGTCDYKYTDRSCQYGCLNGLCSGCQPQCGGKECGDNGCGGSCGTCNKPPATACVNATTLRQYGAAGTCSGSACTYTYTDKPCPYGCANAQCQACQPACAGKSCGDNGCGGSCPPGCSSSGQACVNGTCAPLAVLIASQTASPAGTCPAGYQNAGRWKTYPFKSDSGNEAADYKGQSYDFAWMTLCSADPAAVYIGLAGDDCGGAPDTCAGSHRGQWHVGDSCASAAAAYDKGGKAILAGWITLCVEGTRPAKAAIGFDDCDSQGTGCGAWPVQGQWHVGLQCSGGPSGGDELGATIKTGWMHFCVNSN